MGAESWRSTRQYLNGRRHQLTSLAGSLYAEVPRVEGTSLLCRPSWLPGRPVPLEALSLLWKPGAQRPPVTGSEDAALSAIPRVADGEPLCSYADALCELERPALFENRTCYRLLDIAADHGHVSMAFGVGKYLAGSSPAEVPNGHSGP